MSTRWAITAGLVFGVVLMAVTFVFPSSRGPLWTSQSATNAMIILLLLAILVKP